MCLISLLRERTYNISISPSFNYEIDWRSEDQQQTSVVTQVWLTTVVAAASETGPYPSASPGRAWRGAEEKKSREKMPPDVRRRGTWGVLAHTLVTRGARTERDGVGVSKKVVGSIPTDNRSFCVELACAVCAGFFSSLWFPSTIKSLQASRRNDGGVAQPAAAQTHPDLALECCRSRNCIMTNKVFFLFFNCWQSFGQLMLQQC